MTTRKVLVSSSEKVATTRDNAESTSFIERKIRRLPQAPTPPPLASSLKHILAIQTIKLEGKRDLRISSEVTLSGGGYEDIYTWKAQTHRR